MDGITPALLVGSLVYVVVNFLKYVSAGEWKSVITQACVWIAGVAVVMLVASSGLASGIVVAGIDLENANFADKLIFGLLATSLFSVGRDVIKALDNTQTASVPSWGEKSGGDGDG